MDRRLKLALLLIAGLPPAFLQSAAAGDEPAFSRTEDVIYGRKFGTALTLDVFQPKREANGLGVIFVISGGWFSAHEAIPVAFVAPLVERGYTVFAVVHGSQPKFAIPEIVQDMNRAVRFIRSRAEQYAIDPDRLGIYGGSAGGHLSLMQGTAGDLGDPKAKDPIDRVSSRVQAVACFYPPTDFLNYGKPGENALGVGILENFAAPFDFQVFDPKRRKFVPVTDEDQILAIGQKISPINHVSPDDPPTLIIHGDADKLVPIQQAEIIVEKLKAAGVEAKLVVKPGAVHGWPDIQKDYVKIVDWFDEHLKKPAPVANPAQAPAEAKPRARALGVPFDGTPGPLDAITDVAGVAVGHATLISGTGKLAVGSGPVRTGVTAILPRGKGETAPVFAGWSALNGNGEMTGTTWVEESGFLEGPVMITNTHSVGVVRDAVIAHQVKRRRHDDSGAWWSLPVVAETWDGYLNDINGFHIKPEHVFAALDAAQGGPVPEGNVGGETGMICHEFKGGIGTSSRRLRARHGGYTVGVLVQANHGLRGQLRIAGVPVGQEIDSGTIRRREAGSIIIVIATDAPLLPHQLKRLARRASLGLARIGSISGNGSGDLFITFSTANPKADRSARVVPVEMLPLERMDPLFEATVQATEEAIVNALVAAETMKGIDDHEVIALPHDRLQQVLRKYNRLGEPGN